MNKFFLFFLIFLIESCCLSASDPYSIELEEEIRRLYANYKITPKPATKIRLPVGFVGDLHQKLLQEKTEERVERYSAAILAVISRGAGVGGLRTPRNDKDTSYLLTEEEKAIVRPALIDAERLKRSPSNWEEDYFGTSEVYFSKAKDEITKLRALEKHLRSVGKIIHPFINLKTNINHPELANDEEALSSLASSLKTLTFRTLEKTPEIYTTRLSRNDSSAFDKFNRAFYQPFFVKNILTWEEKYQDIPLLYFALHGLPDCDPVTKQQFLEKINSLVPTRVASRVLTRIEENILTILKKKSFEAISSTAILEHFLKKYLHIPNPLGVDPNDILHLFKIVGNRIDDNPKRIEICKEALAQFMEIWPTERLSEITEALITGISYSSNEQMLGFYLDGIKMVYGKALSLYLPGNEVMVLRVIDPIFKSIFHFSGYKDLVNEILADSLSKNCLEVKDIVVFIEKDWVNQTNKQTLQAKSQTALEGLAIADLLKLIKNENTAISYKVAIAEKLASIGDFEALSEQMRESKDSLDRKILELLHHNHQLTPERIIRAAHLIRENTTIDFLFTTFKETALSQEQFTKIAESIATNRDLGTLKKQTKFSEVLERITDANHLIRIIRNPDISLEIKKLTINRLAILNLWDHLAHSLSYSGDKDLSIEIMKKLTPELTPERIIIAAAAQNQHTVILLKEKARQINLNQDQILRFRREIAKTIGDSEADKWAESYPGK